MCKERLQECGVAREFVAELDALEARLAGLGEADVERDVAAQLRQIVVTPADGLMPRRTDIDWRLALLSLLTSLA
jgi:hypothetical protein